jgi:cytochrome c biogenesis protein CcmG, thiol:disulfide interchange protein DsbE
LEGQADFANKSQRRIHGALTASRQYGRMSETTDTQIDRRTVLFGAGLAAAAGAGLLAWRHPGLRARLFNPFRADRFDLPALPGLKDAADAQVPGFSSASIAGQAVYLNAFASWCPSCREEHQALMEFAASGATIHGVASLDAPEETLRFLQQRGNPFARLGVDRHGYLFRALGARGVPAHFVFAPAPNLTLVEQGPMDVARLREKILPALA